MKSDTHNKFPGEEDSCCHVLLIFDNLNPCSGLEHDDHMRLVEDIAGGVDSDPLEMLNLLRISVKIDIPPIYDDI